MSKVKTGKAKPARATATKAKPPKSKSSAATANIKSAKALTRLVEDIIDEGAKSAEDIHRAVLDLPVTVLENLGLKSASKNVKKVQDSSIGAIYKLIHDINHEVAGLATRLLDKQEKKSGAGKAKAKAKAKAKTKK